MTFIQTNRTSLGTKVVIWQRAQYDYVIELSRRGRVFATINKFSWDDAIEVYNNLNS